MTNVQSDPSRKISIVAVFGDPDRQRDLDALLVIVPGGRPLPGTGGQIVEPGHAAAGLVGLSPAPVWCVAPMLKSEIGPADLIGAAIRDGLRIASEQGFRKAGIVIGGNESLILRWEEIHPLAVAAVRDHAAEGSALEEIRFIASDSSVLGRISACLVAPGPEIQVLPLNPHS